MFMRLLLLLGFIFSFHAEASAQPELGFVADRRSSLEWQVRVRPDHDLPPIGGVRTLSVEIGIEFAPDVSVSDVELGGNVTLNEVLAGHNPFDPQATSGLVIDNESIFVAATVVVPASHPSGTVLLFGTHFGAELIWGGQSILAGTPDEFVGARIIQDGVVFDGITGKLQGPFNSFPDANIDTVVNTDDIPDFVTALLDLSIWQTLHPGSEPLTYLDGNLDGLVKNEEIPPFVAALLNPPFLTQPAAVPEPGAAVLLCLGSVAVFGFVGRGGRAC
ncbi:MAG: hypothetical protein ACR2NU_10875 [Aeoliella sp.]